MTLYADLMINQLNIKMVQSGFIFQLNTKNLRNHVSTCNLIYRYSGEASFPSFKTILNWIFQDTQKELNDCWCWISAFEVDSTEWHFLSIRLFTVLHSFSLQECLSPDYHVLGGKVMIWHQRLLLMEENEDSRALWIEELFGNYKTRWRNPWKCLLGSTQSPSWSHPKWRGKRQRWKLSENLE